MISSGIERLFIRVNGDEKQGKNGQLLSVGVPTKMNLVDTRLTRHGKLKTQLIDYQLGRCQKIVAHSGIESYSTIRRYK